jgi:hypothetical protein
LGTAVSAAPCQAQHRLRLTIEKIPCRAVNKFIQWIDLLTAPGGRRILAGLGQPAGSPGSLSEQGLGSWLHIATERSGG